MSNIMLKISKNYSKEWVMIFTSFWATFAKLRLPAVWCIVCFERFLAFVLLISCLWDHIIMKYKVNFTMQYSCLLYNSHLVYFIPPSLDSPNAWPASPIAQLSNLHLKVPSDSPPKDLLDRSMFVSTYASILSSIHCTYLKPILEHHHGECQSAPAIHVLHNYVKLNYNGLNQNE